MSSAEPETPARGTRPRNRRAITLEVATELFYRHGYAQVSMIDIAAATNVGASALYRHFPSKSDLLVAAVQASIEPYADALHGASDAGEDAAARLAAALRRLAAAAIEHRRLGVLWQRDARNLGEDDQRTLRDELSATTSLLSQLVLAARTELDARQADTVAWCVMGALVSLCFHSLELPRPRFDDLMIDIVTRVTSAAMPAPLVPVPVPHARPAQPEARRDELISVATALFADRGFAATGIDEIGEAVGIAGPSVYSHFANKQSILAAAIQRASDVLQHELDAVLLGTDAAAVKLARLVDSYVRVANQDRFIIRTLISDMDQLDTHDRERARREQRAYIDAWVGLLQEFSDADAITGRIRVQAVLIVVNDTVQTTHLRVQPGFEQTVAQVAKHVLGVGGAG